jgi:hypothetical protein
MPASDVNFEEFNAAFRKSGDAEMQPIDLSCREFCSLSLDELSLLQAPEELSRYIAILASHFRELQAITASDADHVVGLAEKMVAAPGYLRFLSEEVKRQEIARLLDMAMIVLTRGMSPGPAENDMFTALGLLLYGISPSEQAASVIASVRPSDACPALQYHYNAVLALNYVLTGRFDEASWHAAMARMSAVSGSDIACISILQGCIAIWQGDTERAIDLLEQAASLAPSGRMKALAHFYRGLVFSRSREYESAIGCFIEAGTHVSDPMDCAVIHNNIGSCARLLGDLSLAGLSFEEMEKLADRMDRDSAMRCRMAAHSHYGSLLLAKGEHIRAISRFRQALKLARQSGDRKAIADQMGNLGRAYARGGDASMAMHLLNACMAFSESMSYWPGIRFAYWHIGQMLLENGKSPKPGSFSRYILPGIRN